MKVKTLINNLKLHDPESEIAVYYWTQEGMLEWLRDADLQDGASWYERFMSFTDAKQRDFAGELVSMLADWEDPPRDGGIYELIHNDFDLIEKEISTYKHWLEEE